MHHSRTKSSVFYLLIYFLRITAMLKNVSFFQVLDKANNIMIIYFPYLYNNTNIIIIKVFGGVYF